MKRRVITFMLFLCMVFSLAAITPCAGASVSPVGNDIVKFFLMPYKISSGDTLINIYSCWGLDYRDYGHDIQSINQLETLDIIPLDCVLWLPTTESNLQNDTYIQVISHTVVSGDTVTDICGAYGVKFSDAQKWMAVLNRGVDLTTLYVDQELLVPLIWK